MIKQPSHLKTVLQVWSSTKYTTYPWKLWDIFPLQKEAGVVSNYHPLQIGRHSRRFWKSSKQFIITRFSTCKYTFKYAIIPRVGIKTYLASCMSKLSHVSIVEQKFNNLGYQAHKRSDKFWFHTGTTLKDVLFISCLELVQNKDVSTGIMQNTGNIPARKLLQWLNKPKCSTLTAAEPCWV